jgi:hypothetical protein
MGTVPRVVGVLAVLSGVARAVRAQYPRRRDGFWIGFGLGFGSANVRCNTCSAGPHTDGVTGFLKLGGSPSQHLLIGGAINSWSHYSGGATETMANLTGSLSFYPRARTGLFFTGGLGLSGYTSGTGGVGTRWREDVIDLGLGVTVH